MTDRPWLFRPLEYLVDVFSEMSKWSLALQRKQLAVFVASDKIRAFKRKLQKTCTDLMSLTASQHLKIFLMRLGGW